MVAALTTGAIVASIGADTVARTLAYDPKAILLDEPFGPLDALTRLQLEDLLLKLWRERAETTVIFITHELTEAIALADRWW